MAICLNPVHARITGIKHMASPAVCFAWYSALWHVLVLLLFTQVFQAIIQSQDAITHGKAATTGAPTVKTT